MFGKKAKEEAPPAAQRVGLESLTPARLEEITTQMQRGAEISVANQLLQEEHGRLAEAKLALRMHGTGGFPTTQEIARMIRVHAERIGILGDALLELASGDPLPVSELEVARADLVVADKVPAGPNRAARRRGRG